MEAWVANISRTVAKVYENLNWLPAYAWRFLQTKKPNKRFHLILAVADHFEPYINPQHPRIFLPRSEQLKRVREWCKHYRSAFQIFRDSSGIPFQHTYFYPAEQCDAEVVGTLAEHCCLGWGEVEIHLHHGVDAPDTVENTRKTLVSFRDFLAGIGCLCKLDGIGIPRYAFVHGNWALANSANGQYCGVDSEMQILADTGCYADFTMPSAPGRGQVAKTNSMYEAGGPLQERAPHRYGRDLSCGVAPKVFPLLIQGPLMLDWSRRKSCFFPSVENSALTAANPPTLNRLRLWIQAAITVRHRPEWLFVKLHCHGMDPRDSETLLGAPMLDLLRNLALAERDGQFITHFVTAREMTNIALAACEGKSGNPDLFRHSPLVR